MIINTSTQTYVQIQNPSDAADKKIAPQPEEKSSAQGLSSPSSEQTTISGRGLMMSRLFGNTAANPPVQTQLTRDTMGLNEVNFLTESDRSMLSDLYAKAQQQGVDLRYVDDLGRDLGKYRMFGGVQANLNDGNFYDNEGRRQTFKFTADDSVIASRILSGNNLNSSLLDAGFIRFELDPGLSSTHRAHFDFLEDVVNNFSKGGSEASQTFSSKFSSYQQTRNDRYVVETAAEVTRHTPEPDFECVNGVFRVTESGMKNGYRMDGQKVVLDPQVALASLSHNPKILLDYLLNSTTPDGKNSLSLLDYLSSVIVNGSSQK